DSLGEYIRKRRLTVAADRLLTSQTRILDLALEARFESQEAVSRAFKKAYDLTPGDFRKRGRPKHARDRKPLDEQTLNHRLERVTIEPEVKSRPAYKIVGVTRGFDSSTKFEIPAFWEEFHPLMNKIPNRVGHHSFGVIFGWPCPASDNESS